MLHRRVWQNDNAAPSKISNVPLSLWKEIVLWKILICKILQALLEAMEQQSVSIAKSGLLWSLPARSSVICAANPNGGHYDKLKTLSENINMNAPLLSRFDLVFLLLDKPNEVFCFYSLLFCSSNYESLFDVSSSIWIWTSSITLCIYITRTEKTQINDNQGHRLSHSSKRRIPPLVWSKFSLLGEIGNKNDLTFWISGIDFIVQRKNNPYRSIFFENIFRMLGSMWSQSWRKQQDENYKNIG